MTKFYRINNSNSEGLWYNQQGEFTGLIHTKYKECLNSSLEMPFDPEIVGYISVADSIEHLLTWFPKPDILRLQDHGYCITEFESDDVKFYGKFQHNVINQKTAKMTARIYMDADLFLTTHEIKQYEEI